MAAKNILMKESKAVPPVKQEKGKVSEYRNLAKGLLADSREVEKTRARCR